MQADRKSGVSVGVSDHSNLPSSCVDTRTTGTSNRYRLRSPTTRQARSLGAEGADAGMAGIRGGPQKTGATLTPSRRWNRDSARSARTALARLAEIAENDDFARGQRRTRTAPFGRRAKGAGPFVGRRRLF